jgi:hypothetical protein
MSAFNACPLAPLAYQGPRLYRTDTRDEPNATDLEAAVTTTIAPLLPLFDSKCLSLSCQHTTLDNGQKGSLIRSWYAGEPPSQLFAGETCSKYRRAARQAETTLLAFCGLVLPVMSPSTNVSTTRTSLPISSPHSCWSVQRGVTNYRYTNGPQLYEQVIKSQPRCGICYHEFNCLCNDSEERATELPTGGSRCRRTHGCSCVHAYISSLQERTPDAQQSLRHGSRTSHRTKIDAASTYVLAASTHFGYMSGTGQHPPAYL